MCSIINRLNELRNKLKKLNELKTIGLSVNTISDKLCENCLYFSVMIANNSMTTRVITTRDSRVFRPNVC